MARKSTIVTFVRERLFDQSQLIFTTAKSTYKPVAVAPGRPALYSGKRFGRVAERFSGTGVVYFWRTPEVPNQLITRASVITTV